MRGEQSPIPIQFSSTALQQEVVGAEFASLRGQILARGPLLVAFAVYEILLVHPAKQRAVLLICYPAVKFLQQVRCILPHRPGYFVRCSNYGTDLYVRKVGLLKLCKVVLHNRVLKVTLGYLVDQSFVVGLASDFYDVNIAGYFIR